MYKKKSQNKYKIRNKSKKPRTEQTKAIYLSISLILLLKEPLGITCKSLAENLFELLHLSFSKFPSEADSAPLKKK